MRKRANGEGTICKRKSGGYEGRVTTGRDADGKLIRTTVYGKTREEVSKKMTAILHDLQNGTYIKPEKMTFGEWLDTWSTEYLGGVKESTATQYKYHINFNIKPFLGDIPLQKLDNRMIQNLYKTRMEKAPEGGKVLSPKSVKNLHGVISKSLSKAVQIGFIRSNPATGCELPRIDRKEMNVLKDEYIGKFLEEIKGKQYEDLFFVDLFTGMREGEIIGLTWDYVDFDNGIIHVVRQLKRKQGTNNRYFFDTLKNGKTRDIVPAPFVFDVLRKVKKEQAENQLKYGSSYENKDNLVFTNELGNHIGIEALWQAFKRRAEAIGIPDLRFHDLRHSYATISLQNGDNYKVLSEQLGHATVAFTMDVYGHVTDKMQRESANRMQNFYESLSS